jgi:hypothetical protein
LSSPQIVPVALPALQLPCPRVHDQVVPALGAAGAPSALKIHCTAPAGVLAGAGHATDPAAAAPPDAPTPASTATATATTMTPCLRTRAR